MSNNPQPCCSLPRAIVRVALMLAWLAFMFPIELVFWLLRWQRPRARIAQCFFAGMLRILGIRVTTLGKASKLRPLMIVSNHASYLDVFIIGAQLPLSFTPKREIRRWPVIGFLCVLADCIFVERRPAHMEEAREEMGHRIREGRVLCLFPEGTTSDGKTLKPFKSGFLSLAQDFALPVQPASLAYTHIGAAPVRDDQRELVAWVGEETTFFGHFAKLLMMPGIRASLQWHTPLNLADFDDRKALTKASQEVVQAGVLALLEANA
jgi:1-acyl-sn-glycerol-3-phosphate acyltransferase